ncbi:MAG: hypothetical protein AMJ68_03925 [Acidithiobacillales bacterium SG8_45]|jgi:hypothetical protein|nr:MAG: hypothetical protein AMJ68_03925 [Acidithiobacillales bacterium SG8_45]
MAVKAFTLAAVFLAVFLSGCEQCSQDYSDPQYIDTTISPYHLAWRTTNTDLERVTWLNRTTAEAGTAVVEGPVYEVIFPFGYFWVMKISMDIPLADGENSIVTTSYDRGSSCGFFDEYRITFIP